MYYCKFVGGSYGIDVDFGGYCYLNYNLFQNVTLHVGCHSGILLAHILDPASGTLTYSNGKCGLIMRDSATLGGN